jgi:hypothetical protein
MPRSIEDIAAAHDLVVRDMDVLLTPDPLPRFIAGRAIHALARGLREAARRGVPGKRVLRSAAAYLTQSSGTVDGMRHPIARALQSVVYLNDWMREDWVDRSCLAGREIELGIYDDPELRLVSFFHELGHYLDDKRCLEEEGTVPGPHSSPVQLTYDRELMAWRMGLLTALDEGYQFSEKAIVWADEQLWTYVALEEREYLDWVPPEPDRAYRPRILTDWMRAVLKLPKNLRVAC